jgi:PAS domain S-box-containing protein
MLQQFLWVSQVMALLLAVLADERRDKQRLRESEERFRLAADAVNGIIYEFDARSNTVLRTRGLYEVTGYQPAEVSSSAEWWYGLVHPDDRARVEQYTSVLAANGERSLIEYRVRHRDGRWIYVMDRTVVLRDSTGAMVRAIGCTVDVTQQRQNEERYRAFIATSGEAVYRLEIDPPIDLSTPIDEQIAQLHARGTFAECNDALARLHGLGNAAAIVGQPMRRVFSADDPATETLLRHWVREGYRAVDIESAFRRPDGRMVDLSSSVNGVVQDGRLLRIWGTQRDITDRKTAERDADQRNRELAAIARASRELIFGNRSDAETLDRVFDDLRKTLGVELFFSYLVDDADDTALRLITSRGLSPAEQEKFQCIRFGEYYCGRVAETRQRVVINGLPPGANDVEVERGNALTCYAGFPLIAHDRLLGTVSFASRRRGPFTESELHLIQTVCDQVAATQERDRLFRELRRSDARFRAIQETSPDGFMVLESFRDEDGRIIDFRWVYVNESASRIVGRPRERFIGRRLLEEMPGNREDGLFDSYVHVVETGEPHQRELHYAHDGVDVYIGISAAKVGDGFAVSFSDLSDRRRAELALIESESRFRNMANSLPQLAWMARPDGHIFWYNNRWYEYTGTTLESQEGWGWESVHNPTTLPRVIETWTASLRSGQPWDHVFPLRRHDGVFRWFLSRASPVRDAEGRVVLWIGTNTDVEDERQARAEADRVAAINRELSQELQRQARVFDTALSSIRDYVFIVDHDARFVYANRVLLDLWGVPADAAYGKTMAELGYTSEAEAEHRKSMEEIAAGQTVARSVTTYCVQDGSTRYFENLLTPVTDADGRVVLFAGASRDITDRRQEEQRREELLEAERTARGEAERIGRMKDEFLATLSHELRTPLNAMLGWVQILRRSDTAMSPDVKEGLSVIERSARAQSQLINDLLDMSRITSGKVRLDMHRMNLAEVSAAAVEVVRPAADSKNVQLLLDADWIGCQISGDPGRLQQVVWNLLSNAVKFTPSGGVVTVRLRRLGDEVELVVADTGQGISADFLPHVFERFRQADGSTSRRHGGLGLGLSIVKTLIELHGGSVRTESDGPQHGARFTVRLPVGAATPSTTAESSPPSRTATAVRPPSPGEAYRLDGLRVLVVDDDADSRQIIRRVLEESGAAVDTAASAVEAVERITRSCPDLLVSDIGMPQMDGYDLIRIVRQLPGGIGKKLPAVAVTAFARREDRTKALEAGYQAHVVKPFTFASLREVCATLSLSDAEPAAVSQTTPDANRN